MFLKFVTLGKKIDRSEIERADIDTLLHGIRGIIATVL